MASIVTQITLCIVLAVVLSLMDTPVYYRQSKPGTAEMPSHGLLYVAYGRPAREQFVIANRGLARLHNWPIVVVCDKPIKQERGMLPFECVHFPDTDPGARWAKLNMDVLSPFDWTLYMDVDTRVRYSIRPIWRILADGWEMAAVPTGSWTRTGCMGHIYTDKRNHIKPKGLEERNATVAECGWPFCGIQGGVMAFRDTERVTEFFEAWRDEWQRWRDQDQAAVARAYRKHPVTWFPLSRSWNGGGIIGHFHAHARRRGLVGAING